MAYDIFISYSRKDKEKAEILCSALDKAGISYWIDRNIHGAENFLSEITTYIKSCKVVIFVASPNSANSPWTQKEILFALKRKKEIIPYRIGDFRFEDNDELDFVFTNVQWVESVQAVVESLKKLGVQSSGQSETEKTYKVGDYYDDGKKQGVVFEVTADGKHGKIVSLTESSERSLWSTSREWKRFIGADDKHNGANNMSRVRNIAGWREKYPAFAWCADLGDGWYLPAIEELKKFTLDIAVHDAVNRTLDAKGKELVNKLVNKLVFKGARHWYWSSTEYDDSCAWLVYMSVGDTGGGSKYSYYYVRAVSAF